jgi:hypothetical protein
MNHLMTDSLSLYQRMLTYKYLQNCMQLNFLIDSQSPIRCTEEQMGLIIAPDIILPVVLYGCETLPSLGLREKTYNTNVEDV